MTCEVRWCAPFSGAEVALTDAERIRWTALDREEDRARFATGRLLARRLAGADLGIDPVAVVLDATCDDCGEQHGRPVVPGAAFALSIAHSGERVVVALARGAAVGVDVEEVRTPDRLLDEDGGVLAEGERVALAEAEDVALAFTTVWTRKEAVLKSLGLGLRVEPSELEVSVFEEPAVVDWPGDVSARPVWMRALDLGAGHCACVAVLAPGEVTLTVVHDEAASTSV